MAEILFYSGIYDFTAENFISKIKEVPDDEDLIVRLNSPGGSVFAGWGVISALLERKGKNIVKVDGNASSMAFAMIPFFDRVEALDVTSFMVHRAMAYVETEDDQKMLDDANKMLKQKIEARIDKDKFKEVAGISLNDLFNLEERRNIWLTAKEAKKIGFVDKVNRLEKKEITALNKNLVAFQNSLHGSNESRGSENEMLQNKSNNNIKIETMTKQELVSQYPDLLAEIKNEAIENERDRVNAWLEFADVDIEAVKKGIVEKQKISQTAMAAFSRKMLMKEEVINIEEDSPADVETGKEDEPENEENKKNIEAEREAFAAAGIELKDKEV